MAKNPPVKPSEKPLLVLAIEKKSDVSVIDRLIQNEKDERGEQARLSYLKAFKLFQSELPPIERSGRSTIEGKEYPFAKIEDIANAIKANALKHGFSYRWSESTENGKINVTCYFMHDSGHFEQNSISGDPATGDDNTRKNCGTIAILRKHTLTGVAGITSVDEDRDGSQPETVEAAKFIPQDLFDTSFPAWEKLILSGSKTPDQVIEFIETTYPEHPLSPEQKESLTGIKAD